MKSPAINFYTSDFLTGTTFMTNEQVGAYIRLLSYQHQFGHLTKEQVFSITKDELVLSKFKVDKKGLFFNKRMDEEIEKRKKYSESRARNRSNINKNKEKDMKNICKTYEKHMENEIENININNNINNNKKDKYGKYKRIKLTKEEYQRLIDEYGEDFITTQIDLLDEYVESNNNKNKYSNFNLVLRKSIREGWFKEKTANTPGWFDKKNDTKKMTGEEEQEFENIMEGILNDKNRTNSV